MVEDPLTAGGVAIAVAGDALVDVVVVDLGVEEGFDPRFEAEFRVVDCARFRGSEDLREAGRRLPLPRGLMNLVRPTPKT